MKYGQLNFHKIMFFLDVLPNAEEKRAYLNQISSEIHRVIECFESPKIVNLRQYADRNLSFEDNCPELQEFLNLMIDKYSISKRDRRVPSNEQLKMLVSKEVIEYKKLLAVIEAMYEEIPEDIQEKSLDEELTEYEEIKEHFTDPEIKNKLFDEIEVNLEQVYSRLKSREKENNKKAIDEDESLEKIPILSNTVEAEKVQEEISEENEKIKSNGDVKLIWHGSSASLIKMFILLKKEELISDSSPEKVNNFLSKYFVTPDGKKIEVTI